MVAKDGGFSASRGYVDSSVVKCWLVHWLFSDLKGFEM